MKAMLRSWALAMLYPKPGAGLMRLPRFIAEFKRYRTLSGERVMLRDTYPCLGDRAAHTPFDGHYFFQGAWLARRLAEARPQRHTDVGSSVMSISVLSGFVDTVFVDYRPLEVSLPGLTCEKGDITALPYPDSSLKSVSCLHVIEHIGLGRYGDPLDPGGSAKAAAELQRVLAPGGSLYLSLPVGIERVCFNAHRVHAPATVRRMFGTLDLAGFSTVDDAGRFAAEGSFEAAERYSYGCGMFHFRKPLAGD